MNFFLRCVEVSEKDDGERTAVVQLFHGPVPPGTTPVALGEPIQLVASANGESSIQSKDLEKFVLGHDYGIRDAG